MFTCAAQYEYLWGTGYIAGWYDGKMEATKALNAARQAERAADEGAQAERLQAERLQAERDAAFARFAQDAFARQRAGSTFDPSRPWSRGQQIDPAPPAEEKKMSGLAWLGIAAAVLGGGYAVYRVTR